MATMQHGGSTEIPLWYQVSIQTIQTVYGKTSVKWVIIGMRVVCSVLCV